MADTPDVRPVGDLPDAIGKTAARELAANGITSLAEVAARPTRELLAIHGVGPKAVRLLEEALAERGPRDATDGREEPGPGSAAGGNRTPGS